MSVTKGAVGGMSFPRLPRYALLLMALLLAGAGTARAQVLGAELPTAQGGDYGNGAASGDATGAFVAGGPARPAPAVAYGTPTAYGADGRDLFGALGYQQRLRFTDGAHDAALFVGGGLGSAERLAGVELTLAVYDLIRNTGRGEGDRPFRDGSLSLKLHRRFFETTAVAVGVENAFISGQTDGGRSAYAVVSHTFRRDASWLSSATASLGVGNGRFNTVAEVRRGENDAGLFGSLGVRLAPPVGVLASWTGQDLNLGVSIVVLQRVPVVFTPVLLDVTGRAGGGARFALSLGAAWSF